MPCAIQKAYMIFQLNDRLKQLSAKEKFPRDKK